MERNLEQIKDILLKALKNRDYQKVKDIFDNYAMIDIADSFKDLDEDNKEDLKYLVLIFKIVKPSISSEFFSELDTDLQEEIINSLTNQEVASLVQESSNDDIADSIVEWPANVVDKVLKNASKDQRNEINKLLGYKEDTAGSIMTTEFITLFDSQTVKEALDIIRKIGRNAETIYTLFVKIKNLI